MGDYAEEANDRDISAWADDDFDDIPVIKVKEGDSCSKVNCNGHYVRRKNRKTGKPFLGCSRFPECRNTL